MSMHTYGYLSYLLSFEKNIMQLALPYVFLIYNI